MRSSVQFGEYALFLGERRLEFRGQLVKMGGRALDLLSVLALRQGEVVSARELMAQAWPKVVVTDSSLRVHISELRRALDAVAPNGGRVILNIPGRGYQLAVSPSPSAVHGATTTPAAALTAGDVSIGGRVFGREALVQEIVELLDAHPIVTLVAPGGMGKSTVAAMVLALNKGPRSNPLWVGLSSVTVDDLVGREVARAAGIVQSGHSAASVAQLLRSSGCPLLVLDCCERAVTGVAEFATALLRHHPGLRILATSREPLRTGPERVVRLQSLDVEPGDTTQRSAYGPAVELFVQRASDSGVALRLPDDVSMIARICSALDGMPLAIELAAAHSSVFGLDDLVSLVTSGFRLGSLGSRTAPERHRTLEATFDWSYQLLDNSDRQIFEWLAVFERGTSLTAILRVLAPTGLDSTQISHGLARLVEKSLVKLVQAETGSFYLLLDTVRAFAAARLAQRGEVLAARRSHAEYMLEATSAPHVEGQDSWAVEWLGPRAPNVQNLRAALAWSLDEPSAKSLAIRLAAVSAPNLLQLSLLEECVQICKLALALAPDGDGGHRSEITRLMAYLGGALVGTLGPADETLEALDAALSRARESGDKSSEALVLSGLFWLWIYRSEPVVASRAAIERYQASKTEPGSDLFRDSSLAYASTFLGDQDESLARLTSVQQRNVRLPHGKYMRIGSDPNVFLRVFTVKAHWLRGEIHQARSLYERHLESLQKPEHGLYYCWALNEVMIPMLCFLEDWPAARLACQELLDASTRQAMSVRQHAAMCTSTAIALLQGAGDPVEFLKSIHELRKRHFALLLPWFDGIAAQAALRCKLTPLAMQILDQAIDRANTTGSRWWLPELHRIRGLCLLESASGVEMPDAVSEFRLACELARSQSATALELSAAVTWVRAQLEVADEEARGWLSSSLASAPEMYDFRWGHQARQLLESS